MQNKPTNRMRRHYTDGEYGQIHFQSFESGRPIVLLHQSIMTGDQFAAVFEPLIAHGFRPIAIDMPGFGMSDAPQTPPTIDEYATCVAPVLDTLGIERAAVAGHHTGSMVATAAAIAHSDRISAVILHGVGNIAAADNGRELINAVVAQEKAFTPLPGAAHMCQIAALRESFPEPVGPDRISDYVVQAMLAWQRGAYWYGHSAARSYDHDAALPLISQPTLILTNTGDVMHEYAAGGRALRPDFAYVEIDGGGIDICDQKPAAWADAIADFLLATEEGTL